MPDTLELRGLVMGCGPLIEVLGPRRLRKELAEAAKTMTERSEA